MPEHIDDLPPFTSLTNEEEWQRKAEYQPPGTYYVVTNSESFHDFEEYRSPRSDTSSVASVQATKRSSHSNISIDDGTLILGLFEDVPRRLPGSTATAPVPESKLATQLSSLADDKLNCREAEKEAVMETGRPPPIPASNGDLFEAHLRSHYRLFVRRHVFRINKEIITASLDIEDYFEIEAGRCPPVRVLKSARSPS